jgi:hypothetical protein
MVWQQGERTMITAIAPHTRIDNDIIVNMAEIGVYCYAVYSAIKMHLNQATGACFPSYATIARITGIHRSTVIECVKKLKSLKLLSPHWRFKDDGSHNSNQYDFQAPGKAGATTQGTEHAVPSQNQGAEVSAPAKKTEGGGHTEQGSRPERPPLVGEDDHPSRPQRPKQSEENKKKERTREISALLPTEKQKTCQHPTPAIVHLSDNITICHHCYGLLDENLKLQEEDRLPAEGVCAA